MKLKKLLIFFLIFFINKDVNAQSVDSTLMNKKRFFLVSSSLAAYFGASFYYVQNSWWSDISNDFHFDPGNDLVYALNVDKAAHFFGGLLRIFLRRSLIERGLLLLLLFLAL